MLGIFLLHKSSNKTFIFNYFIHFKALKLFLMKERNITYESIDILSIW